MENDVLKQLTDYFKPILVCYIPDMILTGEYNVAKYDVSFSELISKIKELTENKYIIITIPTIDENIKLELLSVINTKNIGINDLDKYIQILQRNIFENYKKEMY